MIVPHGNPSALVLVLVRLLLNSPEGCNHSITLSPDENVKTERMMSWGGGGGGGVCPLVGEHAALWGGGGGGGAGAGAGAGRCGGGAGGGDGIQLHQNQTEWRAAPVVCVGDALWLCLRCFAKSVGVHHKTGRSARRLTTRERETSSGGKTSHIWRSGLLSIGYRAILYNIFDTCRGEDVVLLCRSETGHRRRPQLPESRRRKGHDTFTFSCSRSKNQQPVCCLVKCFWLFLCLKKSSGQMLQSQTFKKHTCQPPFPIASSV
ncbi:unnamed protein product [Boreogadus saida]